MWLRECKLAHLRKVFTLLLPGLTLTILAMEGVLRLVGVSPFYLDGRAFTPSDKPEMIYELRPGFSGLYAGVPISINALGFRGRELSNRDGKAFRVAVIGDSVAFGQGVREGETLADQLATRLQRKTGTEVEAVNLGVPGYDTCQEYWTFREKALSLKPRVALLLYVENDIDPPVFQVRDGGVVSPDVRTGRFGAFMAALRIHSYLYNFVWTRWGILKRPKFTVGQYHKVLMEKFRESSPGWKRSRACLGGLTALARAHTVRLITIPVPILGGGGLSERPYPFKDYITTVCQAARAEGSECLDVVPELQRPGIQLTVSKIDPHPSGAVYARISERVAEMLEAPQRVNLQ